MWSNQRNRYLRYSLEVLWVSRERWESVRTVPTTGPGPQVIRRVRPTVTSSPSHATSTRYYSLSVLVPCRMRSHYPGTSVLPWPSWRSPSTTWPRPTSFPAWECSSGLGFAHLLRRVIVTHRRYVCVHVRRVLFLPPQYLLLPGVRTDLEGQVQVVPEGVARSGASSFGTYSMSMVILSRWLRSVYGSTTDPDRGTNRDPRVRTLSNVVLLDHQVTCNRGERTVWQLARRVLFVVLVTGSHRVQLETTDQEPR